MDLPTSDRPDAGSRRDLIWGLVTLEAALAPALAAMVLVPEFSTQDGPAHLYNARILNDSLRVNSPFSGTFEVSWRPLPNWGGHFLTMAMVAGLPTSVAARGVTALTLVAMAASVTWLRWTVAGARGLATAAVLAVLLGLNVTWLLGFTSFLLGAALMPATLAVWWGGRDQFGPFRAVTLATLLVIGYFCHPISLGLTVVGLVILAVATPGEDRSRRGLFTASSLLPLGPLGVGYRSMTRSGGGLEPVWQHLQGHIASPRAWAAQVGWVDPFSLAAKTYRPFGTSSSPVHFLISPALLATIALGWLAVLTFRRHGGGRRGWLVMASLLLLGGLLGPDTLGVKHGHYLPQRVVLLGLVALVPWLDLDPARRWSRWASGLLLAAMTIQSAFVWDYAIDCRDRLGQFSKAAPAIGAGRRVGTLLAGIKGRFRANPMIHADCLFGVDAANVIWNNYETSHYYFPVKVRSGLLHPPAIDFEQVALLDGPGEQAERARRWATLLEEYGGAIDTIVEWCPGDDAGLDAIQSRWYDQVWTNGPVRVWSRRGPGGRRR